VEAKITSEGQNLAAVQRANLRAGSAAPDEVLDNP
jgi:hypothetical protein